MISEPLIPQSEVLKRWQAQNCSLAAYDSIIKEEVRLNEQNGKFINQFHRAWQQSYQKSFNLFLIDRNKNKIYAKDRLKYESFSHKILLREVVELLKAKTAFWRILKRGLLSPTYM